MIENYLNVTELPEVDLKTTNRLLVIDNENQLQSLNKDVITQVTSFTFIMGGSHTGAQDVYTALKEGTPVNIRLKTNFFEGIYEHHCDYLFPVGWVILPNDSFNIQFEHIHTIRSEGSYYSFFPQQFERVSVTLSPDGQYYTNQQSSGWIGGPVLLLKGESDSCAFTHKGETLTIFWQSVQEGTWNMIWKENSTEANTKTVKFTSIERTSTYQGTAYGIFGDMLYIAKIDLLKKTYTLETKQLNFTN